MVYNDDNNFTKFGRIAHSAAGDEKFEFINEINAVAAQRGGGLDRQHPGGLPGRLLRPADVRRDQRGRPLLDRRDHLDPGRAPGGDPGRRQDRPVRLLQRRRRQPGRGLRPLHAHGRGHAAEAAAVRRPARATTTSSTTRRWTRRAGTRSSATRPPQYNLAGGEFRLTLSQGDIYTGDTTPPPNNFILQDASHAGADWVIETKINSYTHDGGYAQGGLIAYGDGDNYVKFDAITDPNNTRCNRIELRSEVAGAIQNPQAERQPSRRAQANGPVWLRLTKAGQQLLGRVLVRRRRLDAVPGRPGGEPDGRAGLRPLRVQPAGDRCRRPGRVRLLPARRARPEQLRAVRRPR